MSLRARACDEEVLHSNTVISHGACESFIHPSTNCVNESATCDVSAKDSEVET